MPNDGAFKCFKLGDKDACLGRNDIGFGKLTVGVPADEVDSAVDKKLAEASKNVRLPGFRPGKVPMSVMKQRFGPGVRQEVLGDVINQSFQEAVIGENLRPQASQVSSKECRKW